VAEVQEKKEETKEATKREVRDRHHKGEYVRLQSSERATDRSLNIVPKHRQHTAVQSNQEILQKK